jgi:hypothetical protein
VGRASLSAAFVGRVAACARAAGLDHERLANEVADHLASAAARYELEGCDANEAERRAIERFGEAEALVTAIASVARGGVVSRLVRTGAAIVALMATATLMIMHIVPSQSGLDRLPAVVGAVAAATVGFAGTQVLAASRRRRVVRSTPVVRWVPWLIAFSVLGALSAWGFGRINLGLLALHQGGRLYLAAIAALAVLVVVAGRLTRTRVAAGVGLVTAGFLGLVLNGLWNGVWHPFGGLGEGQGNMGIELLAVGWVLLAVSWFRGTGGAPARTKASGWVVRVGNALAPKLPAAHSVADQP